MDENERSGWMRHVRDNIDPVFKHYFMPSLEDKPSQALWGSVSKQLRSPGIRSYFVFAVSHYIDNENTRIKNPPSALFETYLPLAAEVMMKIMYLDNYIIDGKGGTRINEHLNAARTREILISRNLLKARLEEFIETRPELNPEQKNMVFTTMREIFRMVDLAQYWDKNTSGYAQYSDPDFKWEPISEKSEKFLQEMLFSRDSSGKSLMDWLWVELQQFGVAANKRTFVEHYFRRLGLENAAFFVMWAELIMRLKGYEGKEYKRLRQFAFLYGIMAQVVNDNVDPLPRKFVPKTAAKDPEDFCADVRNGLITMPTLLYFSDNPSVTMPDLQNVLTGNDELLFKTLRLTVKNKAKPYGQIVAKQLSDHLNMENDWFENLADMGSFAFSPRLYRHFDDD